MTAAEAAIAAPPPMLNTESGTYLREALPEGTPAYSSSSAITIFNAELSRQNTAVRLSVNSELILASKPAWKSSYEESSAIIRRREAEDERAAPTASLNSSTDNESDIPQRKPSAPATTQEDIAEATSESELPSSAIPLL